jgi:RNA polymerase sigma-70 factor (ECF subfamily)
VIETNIDFIELRKLNAQALTEAHDRYYGEIYRYVRYRVGEAMVSEDLSSEVFVRLIESIHDGRGPKSSLRGWLFGTASNLIGDH